MEYSNTMTLDHFNDFYFLEAVRADIASQVSLNSNNQFRRCVEKLEQDTNTLLGRIAENLAERSFAYIYAACMGEARHASSITRNLYIEELVIENRSDVFLMAKQFKPTPHNINVLIQIFGDVWRGSSYGGKKWQNIAKSLLYYGHGATTFIDHIIDLQHNGGTVFSKSEGREVGLQVSYEGSFNEFLDYKFRKNILTETNQGRAMSVSYPVYQILKRHNNIFYGKEITTRWVVAKIQSLPPFYIRWGDRSMTISRKWKPFANVHKGNSPDGKDAYRVIIKDPKIKNGNNDKKEVIEISDWYISQYKKTKINKENTLKKVLAYSKLKYHSNLEKPTMLPVVLESWVDYREHYITIKHEWKSYSIHTSKRKALPKGKYRGHLTMENGKAYLNYEKGKIRVRSYHFNDVIQNVEVK